MVPVIASALSGLAVAVAAGTGAVAAAVIVTGVVGAVLRRATRPPLPFDSPVVTEGLITGAAFQPALITAQLRGPILAVMTAVVAGMLG